MGSGTYKLAKVIEGRMHYAEVTVSVEFGVEFAVELSPSLFAWLKDEYGPNAWEWPACEDFRKAAIAGAEFALRQMVGHEGMPAARVVVNEIRATLADTAADDVARATMCAVWQALGVDQARFSQWIDERKPP
jgi:hypothetical protein